MNEIENFTEKILIEEINDSKNKEVEIYKSELMEAMAVMKITPNSREKLFYYLCSMNLINAWINRSKKNEKLKLFSDMYFFKTYLSKTIEFLISENCFGANIYFEEKLVIIELNSFQFSFHHIKMSKLLNDYVKSQNNNPIIWSGKKLQPISPLLFRLSKLNL